MSIRMGRKAILFILNMTTGNFFIEG